MAPNLRVIGEVKQMDFEHFVEAASKRFGKLSASQRSGLTTIVDEATARNTFLNRLAYILATSWWETAKTMQPVREAFYISKNEEKAEAWRKKNLHYYPYYGRGYVQLTWKDNYKKVSQVYNHDFVAKPDDIMIPAYAIKILFDGMEQGWFTGKALDDYIDLIEEPDSVDLQEYVKARKIINGKDKAETIGKIALDFEKMLRDAGYGAIFLANASTPAQSKFDEHILSLGLRYFKPYEFLVKGAAHSNPASPAYGTNTDPPEALWHNIDHTAKILDELRHLLQRPIVMTSVYRSPTYNAKIGGATNSQHMKFNAIDFSVSGSPVGPVQWAAALREIRSKGMFKGGIGVYATFVHLDTRGENVDWVG